MSPGASSGLISKRAMCSVAAVAFAAVLGACSKTNEAPSANLLGSDAAGGGYGTGGSRAMAGSPEDFRTGARDLVYFSSDSSDLTPEAQQTLAQQARWLQQYPQHQVMIEGHADERGTREYNLALGARRAQSVRNYLARQGVPHARMRTISFGKERPVAVCDDISCWSQNRRVQTILGGAAMSQRF
jgi:peptidoglycan-associated lipoprotein